MPDDPTRRKLIDLKCCHELEADWLRAGLAQATRERDAAIRRQVHPGDDDRWYVADGVNVEAGERLGPFLGEGAACASVLAWIRWSIDPANVPAPEYGPVGDSEEEP
jgi:hypothetical protein